MDEPKKGDLVQHVKSKRTMFVFQILPDGCLDLRKQGWHIPRANPLHWRVVKRLEVSGGQPA